jgi:MinD-like ATPase involved in chromosome partitioning or flagellar assembly
LADHDQDQTAASEPGRPDPRTSGPGAEDARRGDDGSAGVGPFGWPASGLPAPFGLQPPFGTRAPSPEPEYPQQPAGYGPAAAYGAPGVYDTADAYGPPGGYDTAEYYDTADDYGPAEVFGSAGPQVTPYAPVAPDARSWPQQMSYARADQQEQSPAPYPEAGPPAEPWAEPYAAAEPPAQQQATPAVPAEPDDHPRAPGIPGSPAEPGPELPVGTPAEQRTGHAAGAESGAGAGAESGAGAGAESGAGTEFWAEPHSESLAELQPQAPAEPEPFRSPEALPVQEPAVQEPAVQEPAAQEPAPHEPAFQEPAPHESAFHEPAFHEPAPHEPVFQESAAHEAAFHEPAVQEPADRPPGGTRTSVTADSLTADVLLRGRHKAPSGGWRRAVYRGTGGLIRAPQSAAELRRRELTGRARTRVSSGHHRVAVLSLKGGVGKTTTTVALGATLASVRGDRIIAVDANPDRGTLSDKLRLETAATVRDLLNERDQIQRYADVRGFTTQAASRLEILASDRDPTVSVAFSEEDYYDVAQILEHYYSICLADCGTGLLHSAMAGVLRLADQIVLVSSPSVDGARSASATLDWLQAHGYGDLVRQAVVVLSVIRPRSKSTVDMDRLEQHFAARSRAVVRIPYDPHLEEGAEVDLLQLSRATADAYLALAAEVGDGFARPRRATRPASARN